MSQRSTRSTRSSLSSRSQVLSQSQSQQQSSQSQPTSRSRVQASTSRKALSQQSVSNVIMEDDDDDSDDDMTQQSKLKLVSSDEINQLAAVVIRYLLIADQVKHPITREKIQKNALNKSQHYRAVMSVAKKKLKHIFGFNLIEYDQGKFMIYNRIQNKNGHLILANAEKQQGILFLVLLHIFMSDNSCTEESIWSFLRELGLIEENNAKHAYFGDLEHLILNEFTKQKYIEKVVDKSGQGSEKDTVTYAWGPRSYFELHPRRVMEFMGILYPDRQMHAWKIQFANLLQLEKTPANNEGKD